MNFGGVSGNGGTQSWVWVWVNRRLGILAVTHYLSIENLSINEALNYSLIEDLYHINVRIEIIINFFHHIKAIVKLRKKNNDS